MIVKSFALAIGLGASLVLFAGQVDAQYRYTDDKGVSKVTQYKLDVPAPYRDAAVWIGPTGVGNPALSEEQRQAKQREDAYRRIGEAEAQLLLQGPANKAAATKQPDGPTKPLAQMCIAGVLKVMTSPGVWKDYAGGCASRDPGQR